MKIVDENRNIMEERQNDITKNNISTERNSE